LHVLCRKIDKTGKPLVMVFAAFREKWSNVNSCFYRSFDSCQLLGEWALRPIGLIGTAAISSRFVSRHALLYTEMRRLRWIHGDAGRHLRFDAEEHPVALQLGGSSRTTWRIAPHWVACCQKSISIAAVQANGCSGARSALPDG
jgi:hypothetical protein